MANTKKRRRKRKNNNNNIVLVVLLVIVIGVIAVFAMKAGKQEEPSDSPSSQSTEQGMNQTVDYQEDNNGDDAYNNGDNTDSGSVTDNATTQEISSTTQVTTTEPETLPFVHESDSVSEIVIDFYTDFYGFPEGALFVKESETKETATGYTFTLRYNASNSPNKYICEVYVEKGTGNVIDSEGNAEWNLSDV